MHWVVVPSSLLLQASSVCLLLVLLGLVLAQVFRKGTQVYVGIVRYTQEGTMKDRSRKASVSPRRRASSSQRLECQGWQSWIPSGKSQVLPDPILLWSEGPQHFCPCLPLRPEMLESTEPISYPRWGLRWGVFPAYCQEHFLPHLPSLILLSHKVSEHPPCLYPLPSSAVQMLSTILSLRFKFP